MSTTVNHFICPNCGHDFYESAAYATCDACQRFFYVSESRTSYSQFGGRIKVAVTPSTTQEEQ